MAFIQILALAVLSVVMNATRHRRQDSHPVAILKFVNKHNQDGSYTYGFEAGDGTYKLETRLASGEVKGKYGYIDPNGLLREMEYGATEERGFVSSLEQNELGQSAPKAVQRNRVSSRRNQIFKNTNQEVQIYKEEDGRNNIVDANIRLVNGRRAIVRKRPRKLHEPPTIQSIQSSLRINREKQKLQERQNALTALAKARQSIKDLQRSQFTNIAQQGSSKLNVHNPVFQRELPDRRIFRSRQPKAPRSQLLGRSLSQNQPNRNIQIGQQLTSQQNEVPRSQVSLRSQFQIQSQINHNVWAGHPAQNVNLQDGSYSIHYGG